MIKIYKFIFIIENVWSSSIDTYVSSSIFHTQFSYRTVNPQSRNPLLPLMLTSGCVRFGKI